MSMENDSTPNAVNAQLYFAVLPEWVLYLPISAVAVRVYCVLRRHADNTTGECFPSRRRLAMKSRCSVATLDRSIKELVEHKAISVAKRKNDAGDWSSNLYTVYSTPDGGTWVASKTAPPILKTGAEGGAKSNALTRAKRTQKQELPNYTHEERQAMSLGAALYHTGRTLEEVHEAASTAHGNNQLVIDTYLTYCQDAKGLKP